MKTIYQITIWTGVRRVPLASDLTRKEAEELLARTKPRLEPEIEVTTTIGKEKQ